MSDNIEMLVAELDLYLEPKPYFSISHLRTLGLLGSHSALNAAIKRGILPSIKISSKRTVVPRSAVLAYFRNKLIESANQG